MIGYLIFILRFNATDASKFFGHFRNGLVGDIDEIILFLNILTILRVLFWITAYNHAYFMPRVQGPLVILEWNSQVLFSLFVRPCYDCFALSVEANSLFNDFIFEQIMESVMFSDQNHLIEAFRLVFYAEIASTEVVPSSFAI